MKDSQIGILLANFFLGVAILAKDPIYILFGLLWILYSAISFFGERNLARMDFEVKMLKNNIKHKKDMLQMNQLNEIIRLLKGGKKNERTK